VAAALVGFAVPTLSQEAWPSRPVRIVVPFAPGGSSDVVGRLVAEELSKAFGQPFIVDNRAGAGGGVGTELVAKAPADGYTLLITGIGTNAINHALNDRLGYDSNRDFAHITQVVAGPVVLVTHPSFPARTLKELVAHGKANPGKLSYATTFASSGHLTMEMFKQVASGCPAGTKPATCKPLYMVSIPYRGAGPAIADVVGGQVPFMFVNQDTALPLVRSGKLRALAVSSVQRNPLYPDVPTVAESGYPGFSAVAWVGLSAPQATPKAILDRIETKLTEALKSPAVRAKIESTGFVTVASSQREYADLVRSEIDKWTRVVKAAGIKGE
jgi:tripartite-type tricarboxylate transporter receptor subunit TctC